MPTIFALIATFALAVLAGVLAERHTSRRLIGWDSGILAQFFGVIAFTFVLYAELIAIHSLRLPSYGHTAPGLWIIWIVGCFAYAIACAVWILYSRYRQGRSRC